MDSIGTQRLLTSNIIQTFRIFVKDDRGERLEEERKRGREARGREVKDEG
jgi:hypothetical protein